MRVVTIVLTVILFLVALGLALSNTQPASIRFFLFSDSATLTAPLVVWLSAFFLIGVAVGMVSSWPGRWRARREHTALNKQVSELKKAVAAASSVATGTPAAAEPKKNILKRLGS